MKKIKKHGSLKIYLISRWFYLHKLRLLANLFYRINNVIYQCSISYEADVNPNVRICHARGLFIRPNTVIEEGTVLFQQVIFGTKYPDVETHIHVGKNCLIGANSCILGDVTIGDNVKIGANTVVTKDIPNDCVVISSKAQIIRKNN